MILYFVPKCPKALIHYVSLPRSGAADRGTPVHCKNTFVFNSLHYSTWQTLCKAALYQILSAPNHGKALKSAQQMTASPVKSRTFPAGNVSLRFNAAPSRGNQFPLDTRLRRDTPSALRGNFGLAYNGNGASIFYSCLSHSVFPALRGNEIENQSFREFMFRKDTPTRATGRETGGIEPSRRRFRRHAGSYLGVGSAGGASDEVQTESPQTPLDAP